MGALTMLVLHILALSTTALAVSDSWVPVLPQESDATLAGAYGGGEAEMFKEALGLLPAPSHSRCAS